MKTPIQVALRATQKSIWVLALVFFALAAQADAAIIAEQTQPAGTAPTCDGASYNNHDPVCGFIFHSDGQYLLSSVVVFGKGDTLNPGCVNNLELRLNTTGPDLWTKSSIIATSTAHEFPVSAGGYYASTTFTFPNTPISPGHYALTSNQVSFLSGCTTRFGRAAIGDYENGYSFDTNITATSSAIYPAPANFQFSINAASSTHSTSSITSFDIITPSSTTNQDFVSYGVRWEGQAFSGRLRLSLEDWTQGLSYEVQDLNASFAARNASSGTVFVYKNPSLDIGHQYRLTASLAQLINGEYAELANETVIFTISESGLALPTGETIDEMIGTGEAGTILGALRTRIPFVYMFDLFKILQRLGAVQAEAWAGLTLNFGTIAGQPLSQEFFSEAQIRAYIPSIFFTLIRSIVIAGWWLGFLAYAWKRVSHPTVESK